MTDDDVTTIAAPLSTPTLTKRKAIITTLAEWYPDVLNGWREDGAEQGSLNYPTMGRAWNHPSYQQFERHRLHLRTVDPKLYWHLAEKWLRATRRIRLVCPRCGDMLTPCSTHYDKHKNIIKTHKHGNDVVFYRIESVHVWADHVNDKLAADAITWIASQWTNGEPFIPDELIANSPSARRTAMLQSAA